jgi:tripartite ATP-independent transporter DctP family solute receptor
MKHFVTKTLVAAIALATMGAAAAQERVIKFSTQNNVGHPIVVGMEAFKKILEEKSAGKIKVNLHPGGALGNDQSNVSAIQGGTLEMASMNSGILGSLAPEFQVYDFPFIFANAKEADAVVDGAFGKKMHTKLETAGVVGLAYYELGFRNMTNSKRAIVKVEDIAGLKLRVIANPINLAWVKALDANPTPLPFPEVYAALETKAVDGQENPITVINSAKLYEVQKYLTITNHVYNPQSVIFSKKIWDTYTAAEQKMIRDALAESVAVQRKASRDQVAGALEAIKKGGTLVNEMSSAELAKLSQKMGPVYKEFAPKVGEATITEIFAELAKARK